MSSPNTKPSSIKKRTTKRQSAPRGYSHVRSSGDLHEFLLKKNGLRVLFMRVPKTGSVTVNIVYNIGSRHENRGKTGYAHLLEHMMFKPCRDKTGKIVKPMRHQVLSNEGAIMNATTWNDRTNYYFTMPVSYLPDILRAESERMRGLVLTDKEFLPERQNVLSEFEMYADRPTFALDTVVSGAAFVSHGYGHDTIGFRSDIASCTTQDLKGFYDTYYWPNNACVIVVGDTTSGEVLKEVEKQFGSLRASSHAIPEISLQEPKQEGLRTVEVIRQNPLSLVTVAYKAPPATDRKWSLAQIFLAYLAQGKLSVLQKKLIDTHIASSVSSFAYPTKDEYLMGINASVSRGHTPEEVRGIIVREIEAALKKPLAKKTLARLQERFLADTLFSRDGTHAIAAELTEYVAMGNWERYYTILEDVKTATPEEILESAREYFTERSCIIGYFRGTQYEN